jgi:hypothetical protein
MTMTTMKLSNKMREINLDPETGKSIEPAVHTPGPWLDRGECWNDPALACIQYAGEDANEAGDVAYVPPRTDGAQAANVRLIAAAPDLLAALERMQRWAQHNGLPDSICVEACDAIAKATGVAR